MKTYTNELPYIEKTVYIVKPTKRLVAIQPTKRLVVKWEKYFFLIAFL